MNKASATAFLAIYRALLKGAAKSLRFATSLSLLPAMWLAVSSSPALAGQIAYKFAIVDGIRVFYREAGDPKNPTILLLHGFPSSSHMFRDLIPELENHFHLLAPDYPGMGYSDAPPADKYSPNDDSLTEIVYRFVQQLGETRLILYMQDLGGPIGMRLATKHPDQITGLIFQNTPISTAGWNSDRLKSLQANVGPVTPSEQAAAEGRVNVDTAIFLYRHGARCPDGLNPDAWAADAYALSQPEKRRIIAGYLADARLSLPLYPQWQAYLREKQPSTLVVWGIRDPVFSEAGIADIRQAVPGAKIQLYDTGHFALEEDSEDIADQIFACLWSANRVGREMTAHLPIKSAQTRTGSILKGISMKFADIKRNAFKSALVLHFIGLALSLGTRFADFAIDRNTSDGSLQVLSLGRDLTSKLAFGLVLPGFLLMIVTGIIMVVLRYGLHPPLWVWIKAGITTLALFVATPLAAPALAAARQWAHWSAEHNQLAPQFSDSAARASFFGGIVLALFLLNIPVAIWKPFASIRLPKIRELRKSEARGGRFAASAPDPRKGYES